MRRNCLLKQVTEGNVEGRIKGTGTQGRRRKKLLNDLKANRINFKFKEEALAHTSWRTGYEKRFWPFVRQSRL